MTLIRTVSLGLLEIIGTVFLAANILGTMSWAFVAAITIWQIFLLHDFYKNEEIK